MSVHHAVVFNVSERGHFHPSLPLVKELAGRGVKVTYVLFGWYDEDYQYCKSALDYFGITCTSLYDITSWRWDGLPSSLSSFPCAINSFDQVLVWFSSLEPKPTFVVNDPFCILAIVVANKFQLPLVTSMSFLPRVSGFPVNPKQVQELKDKGGVDVGPDSWLHHSLPLTRRDAFNILHTVEPFVEYHKIPENVMEKIFFAGAPFLDRSWSTPSIEPIHPVVLEMRNFKEAGKKIVLVSLGTVMVRKLSVASSFTDLFIFSTIHAARENENVEIYFLFVGNLKNWLDDKDDIPPNFHPCYSYLPQLQILPLLGAFLTHGGANSVTEALYFGVPMIIVPFYGDQIGNARVLEYSNLGISFPYDENSDYYESGPERKSLTPENMSRAFNYVLYSTQVKDNCKRFSDIFHTKYPEKLVDAVLSWLESKK
eukprot:TRINITY_DN7906_c0_g1_i1.p1 TRINITY_DN7906_c0_g1~~TRINITY_DN7906_c0_g1_i1.p1  ORF type:complete len:426 (+),score=73.87 TRINITY_DN7906_c0_g1_i1:74-1351(+)